MLDRLYEKSKGQCSDSIDVDRINPHEGEIIAAHHFDGLRTTAGLVGCRVVVVVVKRAYLLRSGRRNFIKANSRFVVSVGTRLIGQEGPTNSCLNFMAELWAVGPAKEVGLPAAGDSWCQVACKNDDGNCK